MTGARAGTKAGIKAAWAGAAMAVAAIMAGPGVAGPFTPTAQKFILSFDMFAPAGITCSASGPGVRTHQSRNLAGKPVLRVTGNASGAEILCQLPDGGTYRASANRAAYFTPAAPTEATVTYQRGAPAMTTILRTWGREDVIDSKSFVRLD